MSAWSPRTKQLLARAWAVARVLITVGILGALGWKLAVEWEQVEGLTFAPKAVDVAAAICFSFAAYLGLPLALMLTLRELGLYRRAHRAFYARIYLQSYLYRYVPGKLLVVVERVRLGRLAGLADAQSLLLVAWEGLLSMVGAAVVVFVALGFANGVSAQALVWLVAGAGLALGLVVCFPALLALAARLPLFAQRLGALAAMRLSRAGQGRVVLVYAWVWLALGLSFFFFCRLALPLALEQLPTIVFWYVAAYAAGVLISVAPGGVGVREGFLTLGLGAELGAGEAVALAVASRAFCTVVELACIGAARLIPAPREPPSG